MLERELKRPYRPFLILRRKLFVIFLVLPGTFPKMFTEEPAEMLVCHHFYPSIQRSLCSIEILQQLPLPLFLIF